MRVLQRSTPIALAVSALFGAALLVAAQRAHANEVEETAPTQDPCGSCNRPIAQATGGVAPQTLPAPSRNTSATGAFKLNDLRLNGVKALSNEELQSITSPYICLLYTSPSPRD